MYLRLARAALICGGLLLGAPAFAADGPAKEVETYLKANVMSWLNDKTVVNAIKAQNAKHASLSEEEIKRLDQQWRTEVDAASKPLIESVLKSELSAFLTKKKSESKGVITEVFVMDDKGLNVGQSDITSDYWQGDEAKWKKTFQVGPDAVFYDEIEKDESTQTLQMQVSVSIKDPETGKVIGAVTFGINVDELSS
jgi:predicted nucleic-acid-binding protein